MWGQGFGPVTMGLRPTKWHENVFESRRHPMNWTGAVEVEAAVSKSRSWPCLIRSVRLNEQVRVADPGWRGLRQREMVLKIFPSTLSVLVRREAMNAAYKVAGIDVHKKMLAVVITDAAEVGEFRFERRKFGAGAAELRTLADWLANCGVGEAVMESTAQYWKPVWQALEGQFKLHLAQAHSNRAPKGRKRDFVDAERLVRRHIAGELILSFVPDEQQRLWRTMTRTKQQLTRDRVRLQNQLEGFLEETRIKLSSHVSDLLGLSGRRMLHALAEGEKNPAHIAALAAQGLRATQAELCDALSAAATLSELHRQILKLFLQRLELIETQIDTLNKSVGQALREYEDSVHRLAEVPGLGADSAQQIIAEVGPHAATFPTPGQMASWVGCCPGREESAEVSASDRSPKGNRHMRRVLNQAANAAVKAKGSTFEMLYRRLAPKRGHLRAIWAVAHRLCRIAWKILHEGVTYEERGRRLNLQAARQRANRLIRTLRDLGYQVHVTPPNTGAIA
jgi:transposase